MLYVEITYSKQEKIHLNSVDVMQAKCDTFKHSRCNANERRYTYMRCMRRK